MIIRIMAIDPEPRDPSDDVIVWQVPEKSRACELLTQLLDEAGIEWTLLAPNPHRRRTDRKRQEP